MRTLHDGKGSHPSPHCQTEERRSIEKTHHRDGSLLLEDGIVPECPGNLRGINNLHYCMMGRGRTHHHVAKLKSEDQSRRPIIAMDFFMRMESAPNVQAFSEESVTCVSVKEDRHQSIPGQLRDWLDSLTCLVIVKSR